MHKRRRIKSEGSPIIACVLHSIAHTINDVSEVVLLCFSKPQRIPWPNGRTGKSYGANCRFSSISHHSSLADSFDQSISTSYIMGSTVVIHDRQGIISVSELAGKLPAVTVVPALISERYIHARMETQNWTGCIHEDIGGEASS